MLEAFVQKGILPGRVPIQIECTDTVLDESFRIPSTIGTAERL